MQRDMDLNVTVMFLSYSLYSGPFFGHITHSAVFVLFQHFIHQNVRLIQDSPAVTFGICAVFTFDIFSFFGYIFSLNVNGALHIPQIFCSV